MKPLTRSTVRVVICVTLFAAAPIWSGPATAPAGAATDDGLIRFLEGRVKRDPDDVTALNRLSGEYQRRFRRTGDDRDLAAALAVAKQSLGTVPALLNDGGLSARARAMFSLHGFAAARDDALALAARQPDKRNPLEILGDAYLELGDYARAAEVYAKLAKLGEDDPDAGTLARLARLAFMRGDLDGAEKQYAAAVEAAETMSPPDPVMLAWSRVQAGQHAFSRGDWAAAEQHYAAALAADPADWPALDHVAELAAARRQYDEAAAQYRRLVARVPRPELMQALGDVYKAAGKPADAAEWHDKAERLYLAASAGGNAHYYHHLAGFYCDVKPDPAAALKWAKKDFDEVRQSVYAYDGLAWALYQADRPAEAAAAMDKALAPGTKDAHLLYHASLVYFKAGDGPKARDCLRRAGEANPRFNEFHVHR